MLNRIQRTKSALRIFAPRTCTVAQTQRIGTALRRIRFEGDALRALAPIAPGQQVSVLAEAFWPVGGRNYSISAAADDASWVEIIGHLHGHGAGARLFEKLQPGDDATLWGPGGGFTFPQDGRPRLYLGDETAVGTFLSMLHHEPDARALCAVDDEETRTAVECLHPNLRARIRPQRQPTEEAQLQRDDLLIEELPDDAKTLRIIVAGRTRTCQRLRTRLLEQGLASPNISVRAFWDDRVR